jgi:hypothetical protein
MATDGRAIGLPKPISAARLVLSEEIDGRSVCAALCSVRVHDCPERGAQWRAIDCLLWQDNGKPVEASVLRRLWEAIR